MRAFALVGLFLIGFFAPAEAQPWEERIRAEHRDLLDRLDTIMAGVTAQAEFVADSAITRTEVAALLAAAAVPLPPGDVTGGWRCRSIQIDLSFPIAYRYFDCAIRQTPDGLFFEKTTGSQRRSGLLFPEGDGFVFLGSATVNEEPRQHYSTIAQAAGVDSYVVEDDSVGRLTRIGDDHLLLAFPIARDRFELYDLRR